MIYGKWIKGCESAHCIEVKFQKTQVKIRDSKNPKGPVLVFTRDEWDQFRYGVEHGAFD
jgi:hypothetical protein